MRVQSLTTTSMSPLPSVVAQSAVMRRILTQVHRYAEEDCPILIEGESGTGKELIARTLHAGRGPFVVIDCTYLTPQLAETELFGCVRGAYTGADTERVGLVEAAHGGVAFFDEIGELSLDVQAKLLRVLQQKTFRRVGSSTERRSDFRIIAATNRDLKLMSQENRFRQDLYYRLNVIKVRLPALRERREDIPVLIKHFLQSKGWEMPSEVMDSLLRYNWPGNVRQLENSLKRMIAHSTGDGFTLADIPETICTDQTESMPTLVRLSRVFEKTGCSSLAAGMEKSPGVNDQLSGSEPQPAMPALSELPLVPLQQMEYWMILRALQETGGDRSQAADLLGIGRTTLYRKIIAMEKRPDFQSRLEHLGFLQGS